MIFPALGAMLASKANIFAVELTGTACRHTHISSFHQSPSLLERGRTGRHRAACLHALAGPCQSAELLHQGASLLRQPLLDSLESHVSFLLRR
jgi:hypothetical protein